jgi:hypothetical protein
MKFYKPSRFPTHVPQFDYGSTTINSDSAELQSGLSDYLDRTRLSKYLGAARVKFFGLPNEKPDADRIEMTRRRLYLAVEGIIIWLSQMCNARDAWDLVRATTSLCHALFQKTIILGSSCLVNGLFDILVTIYDEVKPAFLDFLALFRDGKTSEVQFDEVVLQAEEAFPRNKIGILRESLRTIKDWTNNPILKKLKKIFNFLLTTSIFETVGIDVDPTLVERALIEANTRTPLEQVDYLSDVLDSTLDVIERCVDAVSCGNWRPLVFSSRSFARWVDLVYSIKEDNVKLHNPQATGVCYHEFLQRIYDTIEQGDTMIRYGTDLTERELSMVKRLLSEV